jgi:hypothetical protein
MNVELGTEAPQFPEKEYINGFSLQYNIGTINGSLVGLLSSI